jgi:hypothetical protein
MTTQTARLKWHFDCSYRMLEDEIRLCPEGLWQKKKSGFVFWQQIMHALTGVRYWMRPAGVGFAEPFPGKKIFPELDGEPETDLTKQEVAAYADEVKRQAEDFFGDKTDDRLSEPCAAAASLTNLDAIAMQLRHLLYHVGHLDAILREEGFPATEWRE